MSLTHEPRPLAAPATLSAAGSARERPKRRPGAGGFNTLSRRALITRYVLLVIVLAVSVGPLLWELSTSLKSVAEDVYSTTPNLLPKHPTLSNYTKVANTIPVWHFAENSLLVAFLNVGGNIIGATIAGFALARLEFRGKKLVFGLFLATLVLPAEVTIISQFQTIVSLGFGNSLIGVALPAMISTLNVLLMRNAFMAIPPEIDAAAVIDGATVLQRLRYIGLPAVKGTISIVAILAFIGAWDDFLWPLLVLQSPDKLTLTVGLSYLQSTFSVDPRTIAAGAMIALIPIIVLFVALQRFFFKGVGEGAVKG
ncbi:ABC transporter permease [Streptomyces sp. 150FB]|uniref:carbohydrate ABC transporter permease n=1 Tax=Streptomyces sp. 150FB TaxID=1576605 RepID=UPI00058932C1|nr:carbohydrate ABC transporter permease [Streptomyces sp. 150FB]KIF72847.1 ABC transporter permease [Streptomyces sp. 150FB]